MLDYLKTVSSSNLTSEIQSKEIIFKLAMKLPDSCSKKNELILSLKLPSKSIEPLLPDIEKFSLDLWVSTSSWLKGCLNRSIAASQEGSVFNGNLINDPFGPFNGGWTPKVYNGLSTINNIDSSNIVNKCNLAYGSLEYNPMLPLIKNISYILCSYPHFVAGGIVLLILNTLNINTLEALMRWMEKITAYYLDLILVRLENMLSAITLYNYLKELITKLLSRMRSMLNYVNRLSSTMLSSKAGGAFPPVSHSTPVNGSSLFSNLKFIHSFNVKVSPRLINYLNQIWVEFQLYDRLITILLLNFIWPLENYISYSSKPDIIEYAYTRLIAESRSLERDFYGLLSDNYIEFTQNNGGMWNMSMDDHFYAFNWHTFRFISNNNMPFYSYSHYNDPYYRLNNLYHHVSPEDLESFRNIWNISPYPANYYHIRGLEFIFLNNLLHWLEGFF